MSSPKKRKWGRLRGAAILLLVNVGLFAVAAYAIEAALRLSNPSRRLPPDGRVNGRLLTGGHEVRLNAHGFRGPPIVVPKPSGHFRIVVLGDSLTWGVGIAEEERYTDVLEQLLAQHCPGRAIEVLNLARKGYSTVSQRDVLAELKDEIDPDLVVVGFCLNDPQPKPQAYSPEREAFDRKHGPRLDWTAMRCRTVGLREFGKALRRAAYRIAELVGMMPTWQDALERTYEPESSEWREFAQALCDIRMMCDEMGLSSPISISLNQGVYTDRPTNYGHPDDMLRRYLDWYHQAEAAADDAGFVVCNVEDELAREYTDRSMTVNVVDGHPNADLNAIYARRLADVIAQAIAPGPVSDPVRSP